MRILDDCLTHKMALEMLNAPRGQNMRIYRMIENDNLETIKIGNIPFIDREQFIEAASLSVEYERFPPYIAAWPLSGLADVHEAAQILGVTTRTIHNLSNSYVIESIDLSHWGGHLMFSKVSLINERNRRGMVASALERKRTPRRKHVEPA